jgi:ABC-type nickel/cobalt efflux system permease component RcnA
MDGGIMAGVVVGAVAITLLIVLAVWLTWRKMRRARSHKSAELQHEHADAKLRNEYERSDWHGAYGAPQETSVTRRQELWAEQASPKEMPVREVAELDGSGR